MDEEQDQWIRVPVGDDAARWATRVRCRRVLFVVHNVTSATRLLDVLPLFDDDLGVQLLATCTGSSAFRSGVADLLADTGLPVLPWEQALATPVDLAISASFGGELGSIQGPLIVLSHGIGYTKRLAAPSADADADATVRPRSAPPPVFGLAPDWLLADGVPLADALVLSHPEQFDRLAAACPEALPSAVLAGDPCFDRMLAARPYRDRFRRALGVGRGQRLVLLNSTWSPRSLLGDGDGERAGGAGGDDTLPALLPRLASELPADEYRVAAVLHPNIWHGHGPGQIRAWLDRARGAGLALIDPLEDWRQALLAADVVIGDHGSVTYYAAALGTPVLLGAAPLDSLDPDAPIADFIRTAPGLDARAPLRGQVDALIESHVPQPGPMRFTSSVPGEAAVRLRRAFYGLMAAPEPPGPALLLPLPDPGPTLRTAPLYVLTRVLAGPEVVVTRYADPAREPAGAGDTHLAVHEDTRDPGQLGLADVVFRYGVPGDPRFGPPGRWAAEVLDRHPHCALAAYVTGPSSCVVRPRDGALLRLTSGAEADADPAVYASAVHAWLAAGRTLAALVEDGLTVRTGPTGHHMMVTAEADGRRRTERGSAPPPLRRTGAPLTQAAQTLHVLVGVLLGQDPERLVGQRQARSLASSSRPGGNERCTMHTEGVLVSDPQPFTLVPGAAGSPVLLHVPHGSRRIPRQVRAGITLDDAALERELDHITDAHTAELAAAAAEIAPVTPWRFVNSLSRLVVDPERFPDEREEMLAVGMGAVYTRTTHREPLRPPETDPGPLLEAYFHPYADAMTAAVDARLAAVGRAVIIDVHSYPAAPLPYELHGTGPRPPVCLGTDPFHTPPELLAAAEAVFGGRVGRGGVGRDTPFAGTYVPLRHYGTDRRVTALMIEIRRDTYMREPGGPAGPGLDTLARALAELVGQVGQVGQVESC